MGTLEEADTLAVRTVYLRLPNVDYLGVLEEFRVVEAWLHT